MTDSSNIHLETPNISDIRIDNLSDVIKAQIQATKDYSYAFVRILTSLEDIKVTLDRANNIDSVDTRDILIKLTEISENIKLTHEIDKDRHEEIADSLMTYHELTKEILEEIKDHDSLVLKSIDKIPGMEKSIKDEIVKINDLLTYSFNKANQNNEEVLSDVATIEGMNANISILLEAKNARKKWFIIIWDWAVKSSITLGIVWAILEGLIQTGILKILWFSNGTHSPVVPLGK